MTESEEMYLVTIARLKETGVEGMVPLSLLAGELDILPVSANQMVRKLEDEGLIEYLPYKGVQLTETGCRTALEILRNRRLWEVFLVERLNYTPQEADPLACRLEHALPSQAAERLANYLGSPQFSPRGETIPPAGQHVLGLEDRQLQTLKAGFQGVITRIETPATTRSFLSSQGFLPGEEIEVLAVSGQGDVLASHLDAAPLHLASSLAANIWVRAKE